MRRTIHRICLVSVLLFAFSQDSFGTENALLIQEVEESAAPLVQRILSISDENPPDLVVFLGRFHPLVVHFPIALLLVAFVMEFLTRRPRFSDLRPSVSPMLFLGSVGAFFSVAAGLLLAASGGYGGDTIWWHKWTGIGVAVLSLAAYIIRKRAFASENFQLKRIYSGLVLVSLFLLVFASHKGGSLTHGEDYLTSYMPEPIRTWAGIPPRDTGTATFAITNIDEAHVYNDLIQPIFEARCTTCHNPNKERGGLLLTSADALMAGGESGDVINPNNAAGSDLFVRLTLDSGDDDRMPPSGRRPLTDDQIELIGWWIDSGASSQVTVAEAAPPEEISALLTRLTGTAEKGPLDIEVAAASAEDIAPLEAHGIMVLPLSSETNLLQVLFTNVKDSFTPEDLSLLQPIGEQIAWLNLASASVSDQGLSVIQELPNLSRLHLEKTAVTDDGLAHLTNLQHLEYLNLYNTGVTDNGLQHLKSLASLKKLYLWQTEVTPEAAQSLAEAIPDIDVNMGWDFDVDQADSEEPAASTTD